jgi:hypothetical protein
MATNRLQVLKRYGLPADTSLSMPEVARLTKIPLAALREVYNRGVGAWKSNPESVRLLSGDKNYSKSRAGKMSKEQWAYGRLFSFVNRGTTFKTTDADIATKYGISPRP